MTDLLYTRRPIEIYTGTLSAASGDTVTLHVSTTANRFHLQIARVGAADQVVWTKNDSPGRLTPTPEDAWEKGCHWPVTESLQIPHDWRSGFYQISAITADEGVLQTTAYAFVVVRATKPAGKILLVHPTATYGAYNSYGSASFYAKRNFQLKGGFIGGESRLSFLRPWMPGLIWKPELLSYNAVSVPGLEPEIDDPDYDERGMSKRTGLDIAAYSAGFDNWDRILVRWLEMNGYVVDHAISSDLELHPEILERYRLMLSVGHDEYWSWGMRDAVESFVEKGGNVCFFSGNVAVWQIRYEDNGNTVVCYKDAVENDPLFSSKSAHLTATLWSSKVVGRPETSLTGLSFNYAGVAGILGVSPHGPGGYLIYRPEHWVFKGAGLALADILGQASKIIHFEVDGCPIRMEDGLPYPGTNYVGPASMEILGICPTGAPEGPIGGSDHRAQLEAEKKLLGATHWNDPMLKKCGHAVMGMYTNNGTVFAAGTTDWTNGLTGKDPAVEHVTKNLLDRLAL